MSACDPEHQCRETERLAALSALIGWADRRERFAEERADLVAAAWRSGSRNVAELARLARVSRDTIYADLKARSIDTSARAQDPVSAETTPGAPLKAESVRPLAQLVDAVARPAYGRAPDDALAQVTASAGRALQTVADVLDPPADQGPGWTRNELMHGLADTGASITRAAQRELAASQDPDELAERTDYLHRSALHRGRDASAERADVVVALPTGESITVRLGRDQGWTTLSGDSPLLTGEIDGLDHLEVQHALTVLSRVITRKLDEAAFVEKRKDALPGGPAVRQRIIPSNED
ncbi:hypothetical protein SAMN05421805_1238 [Saccharopolyspora antimicrobica]|uniref:Uncharacterized protein n=1 Tax=Saccharopolyspora antimicrobica TaxID=455193 RepID=A0A1I5JL13_9PSEU|nr:hypothetical protein [Saccharopolyspora antimicrobica]RKT84641.1 hypothetical protein ATL45_2965 [Saccharopolyspora antimicrobica]SFO73056.1 hypothetical protein SAMN05421805_1238 [Saccharopolyspora antimicrobica]